MYVHVLLRPEKKVIPEISHKACSAFPRAHLSSLGGSHPVPVVCRDRKVLKTAPSCPLVGQCKIWAGWAGSAKAASLGLKVLFVKGGGGRSPAQTYLSPEPPASPTPAACFLKPSSSHSPPAFSARFLSRLREGALSTLPAWACTPPSRPAPHHPPGASARRSQ